MSCQDVRDRLMDLISGTLPAVDLPALEAHLASCDSCRAERESLESQEAQLRSHFQTLRSQGSLADRVEDRMAGRVFTRPSTALRWRPLAAAATLLIALGFWLIRPGSDGLLLGPTAAYGDVLVKKLGFAVTVFSHPNDLALVRDRRQILNLRPGVNRFRFEDVPGRMDPTSVRFRSLTDPEGCRVLEQGFEYDLVSRRKILQRYVDRELFFERRDPGTGALARSRATLLSPEGIIRMLDGEIRNSFPGEPVLPDLPGGLLTRPALAWTLDAPKVRAHETEVAYLTGGMSWRADYLMTLKDARTLDLDAWVTVDNQSGASYEDAVLKLIAGDPHRVQDPEFPRNFLLGVMKDEPGEHEEKGFEEKSFFEYHLYTLDRPTTLRDRETKQIRLLSARDVPYRTEHVYEPTRSPGVGLFLVFKNAKENRVGMPLPGGQVRLLARDRDGEAEQVGQAGIEHTPKDEDVRIPRGVAMDLVGERKVLSRQRQGRLVREQIEIRLRNRSDRPVAIEVLEHPGEGQGNWQVMKQSHPHDKKDADTAAFRLQVPPEGETVLTYSLEWD